MPSVDPPSSPPPLADYPVREYVAAMAAELAHMSRMDGDATLAQALELAVEIAARPKPVEPT